MLPQWVQIGKRPTPLEIEVCRLLVVECGDGNLVIDMPLAAILPRHTRKKLLFKVPLESIQVVTDQGLPLPSLLSIS
jgi:hypothetical protein